MPPLASDSSSSDDSSSDSSESYESYEASGFEIEAVELLNGKLVVSNIVGLPAEQDGKQNSEQDVSMNKDNSFDGVVVSPVDDEEYDEEQYDSFYDVMENAFTQFAMCGGEGDACHCKPLKSALRDPSRSSTPIDRQVSFAALQIREYDMTLGDHPSAKSGPPLQLDWGYSAENVVNLDDYERARQPRRSRKQMRLSYRDRQRVLYNEKGFTEDEVNAAWLEALTIRKQRHETVKQSDAAFKIEEAWESTQRKVSRLFSV
jgi:hypothetical protein